MEEHLVTVRITGGPDDVARVTARRQQFAVGRPMEFDERAPRIAAIEYALGAAGAEIVNGLRVFADRRRLEIDAIEATVTASFEHALAYLEVVGESGPPVIRRIHIKVFASCADDRALRQLFETVRDRLPLTALLRRATELTTELIVTE
jgi:hypothetical protein